MTSKDGTKVPLLIIRKKGLKLDSSSPTLLYGYGGASWGCQKLRQLRMLFAWPSSG